MSQTLISYLFNQTNACVVSRYSDSNGNSPVASPSPTPGSSQRARRPVSLTVPSLLGKDPSSLSHGSAGSLVEAVSLSSASINTLKENSLEKVLKSLDVTNKHSDSE